MVNDLYLFSFLACTNPTEWFSILLLYTIAEAWVILVNTLRNPNLMQRCANTGRARIHYEGCGSCKCVCIVVGLTVALGRTLVTVEYEEKRKSQCNAPDKALLYHCGRTPLCLWCP